MYRICLRLQKTIETKGKREDLKISNKHYGYLPFPETKRNLGKGQINPRNIKIIYNNIALLQICVFLGRLPDCVPPNLFKSFIAY